MIDMMDFGCGNGGSISWCMKRFGGYTYLGINDRLEENREGIENGYNIMTADITSVDINELPFVRYITMIHLLEHLHSEEMVEKVIDIAIAKASDFIFIKGPTFEKMDYLKSLGYKITWTDWIGHPSAVNSQMIKRILDKKGFDYYIGFQYPIENSESKEIIPLSSPIDTIWYDESLGEKPYTEFSDVWREIYCYIKLRNIDYWNELIKTDIS